MRIDAHQHYWRVDRGDYGWLTPDKGVIYRDFGPADLAPFLKRHEIAKTIVVQAAPTEAETRFLLDIARDDDSVAGVVGWADFETPARIGELAKDKLLVGLRPMVQDLADDDWLAAPKLAPAFKALEANGLVFDALVLPRHLPRLLVVAERHPGLSIVVDHGAKPFIKDKRLDPWRADMAALAARPNIVCKLSGLVTEAAAEWIPGDLAPYVLHLIDVFGPDRLLWGSDWPVVDLAGGYDRWFAAAQSFAGAHDAIFGANAARIYLDKRGRR
jgi:L-fuconolactonase